MRSSSPYALVLLCLVGVGSQLFSSQAYAQNRGTEKAAAAGNTIVAPRAKEALTVEYPRGAHGDLQVTLILVVDSQGVVVSARAEEAPEPFRSHTERTALGWKFEPATRAGAPVAAKIKVVLSFTEPRAPTVPEATPAAAPAQSKKPEQAPKPLPSAKPLQVVVIGTRPPPTRIELTRAEARLIPGTFGDPLRAIEALPGVTPTASGAPYFFLRGAPPGQIGSFLDDLRLPQLYHVAFGPSVLPPSLIDSVRLYPGGYPARYGRFVGGIVEAKTVGRSQVARGEGVARLTDLGGLVEVPFANGRGSVLGGGRYAYVGPILSLFAPDVDLQYWDYQARVAYAVTPQDEVSVFVFGSHDHLGTRSDGATVADMTFHRRTLRWDHRYEQGVVRQSLSQGQDESRGDVDTLAELSRAQEKNTHLFRTSSWMGRSEVEHRLGQGNTLFLGADFLVEDFEAARESKSLNGYPTPPTSLSLLMTSLFPERIDHSLGAWVQATLRPCPGIEVSPGVRADWVSSMSANALSADVRIAGRYRLGDSVDVIQALGTAHQPPSFVGPVPGVQIASLRGGLQKSLQHAAGVEIDLGSATRLTATAFQSVQFNMSDVLGIRTGTITGIENRIDARALGSSRGIELYLYRSLSKRVGGFVSYTLSQTLRRVGRERFPSAFDRTHVLQAALSVALGRGWRAGSRGVYYTGMPVYANVDNVTVPSRTKPFLRLDLRLERRWILGKTSWIAVVAEAQNVLLAKEVIGYDCSSEYYSSAEPVVSCKPKEFGPMTIPNLALEAGF